MLDKIIVVHAPVELRVSRVRSRDRHRTEEQIRDIMTKQMSDQEKLKRADFVIHNDESRFVTTQVLDLHQQFLVMR